MRKRSARDERNWPVINNEKSNFDDERVDDVEFKMKPSKKQKRRAYPSASFYTEFSSQTTVIAEDHAPGKSSIPINVVFGF